MEQPNNPLHGKTLEAIMVYLVSYYGWDELGNRIRINCFRKDPSIKSSLVFLRRTPWPAKRWKICTLKPSKRQTVSKLLSAVKIQYICQNTCCAYYFGTLFFSRLYVNDEGKTIKNRFCPCRKK